MDKTTLGSSAILGIRCVILRFGAVLWFSSSIPFLGLRPISRLTSTYHPDSPVGIFTYPPTA